MVSKYAFRTCLPLHANIHSHILMFVNFSLSFRNIGVCPNLSDQKGITFGLWSHLSMSLVTIIHRAQKGLQEKEENFSHPCSPSGLISDKLKGKRMEGVWIQ